MEVCRFRPAEWREPWETPSQGADYAAWLRYRIARQAWADEHGLTLAQVRGLFPPGGSDAA